MKDIMKTWLELSRLTLRQSSTTAGRATRSELIAWCVLVLAINVVLPKIARQTISGAALEWTQLAIPVVTILPGFALFARRMHDIGLPGWCSLPMAVVSIRNLSLDAISHTAGWGARGGVEAVTRYLDWLILPAFAVAYLVLLIAPGTKGTNRHGPNPRTMIGNTSASAAPTQADPMQIGLIEGEA